jgi:hypothetical protein
MVRPSNVGVVATPSQGRRLTTNLNGSARRESHDEHENGPAGWGPAQRGLRDDLDVSRFTGRRWDRLAGRR